MNPLLDWDSSLNDTMSVVIRFPCVTEVAIFIHCLYGYRHYLKNRKELDISYWLIWTIFKLLLFEWFESHNCQ